MQELNHLLRSSNVAVDAVQRQEILWEVNQAVSNLASALGIINNNDDNNNDNHNNNISDRKGPPSKIGGMNPPHNEHNNNNDNNNNVRLEPKQVAIILQSAKGKKLMSRSFSLLEPVQRWALLPAIITRLLLQHNNSSSSSGSNDDDNSSCNDENAEIEAKLLKTLLQFIQHSYQYQQDQQQPLSNTNYVAPFTILLLINLTKVLNGILIAYSNKEDISNGNSSNIGLLKDSLLSSRNRATLLHQVVTIGDKIHSCIQGCLKTEDADTFHMSSQEKFSVVNTCEEWLQKRESFMTMLDV